MCRAVKCGKCGKTTWAGCGAHVQQVMAGVPQDQRCRCAEAADAASAAETKREGESGGLGGLLSGLFGRR